ncbi:3beta hydroxysteroid dehydrogenase/isomerase family protein, partial [Acanthamoeba castellanii str. Neff]
CQVEEVRGLSYLVTGGGGYLGHRLIKTLLAAGASQVRALDLRGPLPEWMDALPTTLRKTYEQRVEFMFADIRDATTVRKAVEGVDVVFHIASFGMSGREQLQREKIMAVNVGGTKNLIDACIETGVSTIVYTSTTNVVFSGNELPNKDETQPYIPLDRHVDYYSRTKSIAEQTLLAASGAPLKKKARDGRDKLLTCAIRAAGIYGEGEERHLPRIVDLIKKGMFCFTVGRADAKVEFVYVENLPYFISDWEPINNFLFFRPLLELYGYSYPTLQLPVALMFYLALCIEFTHRVVARVYNFQPLLTRAEVFKVGVTHYFVPDKPKKDLGYRPLVTMKEGMGRVLAYYAEKDIAFIDGSKRKNLLEQIQSLLPVILLVIVALYVANKFLL